MSSTIQIVREQKPENSLHVLWQTKVQKRDWVFPLLPRGWKQLVVEDKLVDTQDCRVSHSNQKYKLYIYRASFFGSHEHQESAQAALTAYMKSLQYNGDITQYQISSELPAKL